MKSVLLTLEYPPFKGGVANYYYYLVKYWPDREAMTVIHHLNHWLLAILKLSKILRKDPKTLVLIGQVLPLGTVAYLRYLIKPYDYAVFLHGMDFTFALKKPRKKILLSLSLGKAKKIICANSYVAELVKNFNPAWASKIIIINPGISRLTDNLENITPLLKDKYQTADKITLLSLGRLVKRKGVDNTLKALKTLNPEIQNKLCYIIAGTGDDEAYLKELARDSVVKIIFTGEVGEVEKWSLLDLCDIFIMPSRSFSGDFEGFGIVYLEANLMAKPVIAGLSGGVSDAVSNNENGLLIDPENIDDIAQAILLLVSDAQKRKYLGLNGRDRALNNFLWENQIKKLYHCL